MDIQKEQRNNIDKRVLYIVVISFGLHPSADDLFSINLRTASEMSSYVFLII